MESEVEAKSYLILVRAKRATLIFSIFRKIDLIIFSIGIVTTLLLFMIINVTNFTIAILVSLPLLITGFLIFPLPNYHNMLMFFLKAKDYLKNRRRYYWRGWCYKYDEKED